MNLLQAYIQTSRAQKALRLKPGQKGFSLIELVVVIAVLAVLTAIALPNFLGVSEDASVRTAQQAALNAFKECKVMWAQNKRDGVDKAQGVAKEFSMPAVTDWKIISLNDAGAVNYDSAITQAGTGSVQPEGKSYLGCFMSTGASRNIFAVPDDRQKFPIFVIKADGNKACRTGLDLTKETFNTGCKDERAKTAVESWN